MEYQIKSNQRPCQNTKSGLQEASIIGHTLCHTVRQGDVLFNPQSFGEIYTRTGCPCRTESAHLLVVSGVSSCYAVEPSALHKTIKAMSPRRSLAQSHRSTMPTSLHRQGPTWATRPSTSPSSCRDNSARHVEPARHPHRQPTRLTTTANNDNADSTSQMSKSRRTMQEMHNSTVSPPALARRLIHTLMNRDASHLTSDGRNDHSPHQVGS